MPKTTITSKGQVTIPKAVRDRLGLRPGDRLDFKLDRNGTLTVESLDPNDRPISLAGFLDDRIGPGRGVSIEEMDRAMTDFVAARVVSSLRDRDAVEE